MVVYASARPQRGGTYNCPIAYFGSLLVLCLTVRMWVSGGVECLVVDAWACPQRGGFGQLTPY